jgi:hypothetical protein
MALGFVALAISLIVIQLLHPVGVCRFRDPGDASSGAALLTTAAATLLLVLAALAAIKWRSKWEAAGTSVAIAVVGGGLIAYWLLGRIIDPCLA